MPSLRSVRHSHPNKGRWHILQSLFFIFLFGLAAYFFLQSSFFSVKDIQVTGNKQLTKKEILALTGLANGINIFKADLKLATTKVASHPMIKQVEIFRELPATLSVRLVERKPVGMVADRGSFVVVSDDGCYLFKGTTLHLINLPIITGANIGGLVPGQKSSDEKLNAALNYLMEMPSSVRAVVSEISVADLNNIKIFTIDSVEIRLGDDSRVSQKIELYESVSSQKYKNPIQYIDISYKGSPVIKFVEASSRTGKKSE